jgi:hypothetical protein
MPPAISRFHLSYSIWPLKNQAAASYSASDRFSEGDSPRELDRPWSCALRALQSDNLPKVWHSERQVRRRSVVGMVEQVRYLRSELYPKTFRDGNILQQRHRDGFRRRPLNGSALRISPPADIIRRIDESVGIDPLVNRLALVWVDSRHGVSAPSGRVVNEVPGARRVVQRVDVEETPLSTQPPTTRSSTPLALFRNVRPLPNGRL